MSTVPSFTWLACLRTLPCGEPESNTSTCSLPPPRSCSRFAQGSATSRWKKLCGPRKWLNFSTMPCAKAAGASIVLAMQKEAAHDANRKAGMVFSWEERPA